jgi:hypothetical protein
LVAVFAVSERVMNHSFNWQQQQQEDEEEEEEEENY